MRRCVEVAVAAGIVLLAGLVRAEEPVRFNRDIRPILSDNCFACHGPDEAARQADLRLDVRDEAVAYTAIVPDKPDESLLVERVFSADPDAVMPPLDSHKKLTAAQKNLLRRWIAEGAEYEGHWAYLSPVQSDVPAGANAIDHLVRQRLTKRGLKPSPAADRRTLARRLHFDLIGLPPTPAEVEAFVNDPSPSAYEQLVERLLASPHYGERMALGWLDVVRFADTIGYHSDTPRNVWPYRDYVIRAFNENMPFDRFTIEQLAGDLLPDPTRDQKVASCFNRLLLTTEEGGAQAKDYEARMLTDRVRAVGTVWLGQTLGCCQCHDHKFDPMTQRDFYAMGAFFADIQEPIIGRREPGMLVTDARQAEELARRQSVVADLQQQFASTTPELAAAQRMWEADVKEVLRRAGEAGLPQEIAAIIQREPEQRSDAQKAKLTAHFKSITPLLADLRSRVEAAKKAATDYENSLPRCLVSISMSNPRTVRILPRGNWMDESGPVVQPALPHYLPQPNVPTDRRLTRLDLARWLVARENPLTARVTVNRLWEQFFGIGLSKTLDDLGSQGEWPAYPELLDWLAVEFMDSGWNVKHIVRTIVLSDTYKQSSAVGQAFQPDAMTPTSTISSPSRQAGKPDLRVDDPENRLLARQSRWRLDAELVRDNALAVSGLLVSDIGGPSVKPYQPAGYWENLNFPQRTYEASTGEDQYRRGLYTWWQRSFLHPSLLAFDAPTREECAADRNRSNIPQQALVLLNDPTYVEAARCFAARVLEEGGPDAESRITWAWQQALQRPPRDDERQVVRALLEKHQQQYAQDPQSAEALLKVGFAPVPQDLDRVELAAWTNVARVILNLHETITRN